MKSYWDDLGDDIDGIASDVATGAEDVVDPTAEVKHAFTTVVKDSLDCIKAAATPVNYNAVCAEAIVGLVIGLMVWH